MDLEYLEVTTDYDKTIEKARSIIKGMLKNINKCKRESVSAQYITAALQCGGSDAFSGISANPLQGNVAKRIIKQGGKAVLGETDELIGSGSYILDKVRDLETAKKFIELQDHYDKWTSYHGMSAQSNPSGGNIFRGLYNITIKSLGAAMKKNKDVRLDYCLEYGEGCNENRGYYFMDSPGNDIESVAGQVATGCNVVMFSTGNGSITNHPFVPIIKLMTTTNRFKQMSGDIDINAGEYIDGKPLEKLTDETIDKLYRVCSGEKTRGELAEHSQTQIWREWYNKSEEDYKKTMNRKKPSHSPYNISDKTNCSITFNGIKVPEKDEISCNRIGLILPTNLCSSQIAVKFADELNAELEKEEKKKAPKKAKTSCIILLLFYSTSLM